jgi:hypothetical protein
MAYQAIHDVPEIGEAAAALATAVQERVRSNSEHTSTARLKRHGITYITGNTSVSVASQVAWSNVVGTEGKISVDSVGADVTGQDVRAIGMWVSTPTQRPLCVDIPWPVSANANAIRIVLCSVVPRFTDDACTVEVLAHVWDGNGWYPTPPGMGVCEQVAVTGQESADTFRIAEPWRSSEAFAVVVGSPDVRWDSLLVRMPGRLARDRTTQRDGDTSTPARIVLTVLSRPVNSPTVTATRSIVSVESPRLFTIDRKSHNMPSGLQDGASHMWGVIVGTDGVRRWHLLPCVLSGDGIADVQVACWPPLSDAEVAGLSIDLIRSSPIAIQSIGISEISDA